MIRQAYVWIQTETEPFRNLALERCLLEQVPEGSTVLYLWQNRRTVVVGRNQNAWQECRRKVLEADGGTLARRLSGGGAVYHDLGNLNYTFLTRRADFDVARQLEVILAALRRFGLDAERSGRNDLLCAGRKFSGSAFYESGENCCHHGTLMVEVEREMLGRYLHVAPDKLSGKGVASVQSRVVNLRELAPSLTVEALRQALRKAMEEIYGCPCVPYPAERVDPAQLAAYEAEFASEEWRFGRRLPFQWQTAQRFPWGGIQLQCQTEYGKIARAVIYSDAMDAPLIGAMADALTGASFSGEVMAARLEKLSTRQEVADVCAHLRGLDF